jgi:hypothetical protein
MYESVTGYVGVVQKGFLKQLAFHAVRGKGVGHASESVHRVKGRARREREQHC